MAVPFYTNTTSGFKDPVGFSLYQSVGVGRSDSGFILSSTTYLKYLDSETQPARTAGSTGFVRRTGVSANKTIFAWVNDANQEVLRWQINASSQVELQFWNGSSWTTIGAAQAITGNTSINYRVTVDFAGLGTTEGSIDYSYFDGSDTLIYNVVATGLDLTAATNIAVLRPYDGGTNNNNAIVSEVFIRDGENADTTYLYSKRPTSNGTDATDGTGTYTAIDDAANNANADGDYVTLSAAGQKRSFKGAARDLSSRPVEEVVTEWRLRAGASGITAVKPYLLISGVRYYHDTSPVTLTTAFAGYRFRWPNNPATGDAWTVSAAQDANLEFGIEAA